MFSWRSFFFSLIFSITTPLAAQWTPPEDLFTTPSSDLTQPKVAIDANGNATAVWQYFDGTNYVIQSSYKPVGQPWQIPETISPSDQFSFGPKIVVDANGNATVIWIASIDSLPPSIQSSYKPFEGSWQATPDTIANVVYQQKIAVDSDGNVTALWINDDGSKESLESSYKPFEGSWQPFGLISEGKPYIGGPQIYIDSNKNAFVVWTLQDDSAGTIAIQVSYKPFGDTWQPATTIYDALLINYYLASPQIVVDSNNNATVVWSSYDVINSTYSIQSSYKPNAQSWQTPETISSPTQDSENPLIVVDEDGNVTAVWVTDDRASIQSAYKPLNGTWQNPITIYTTDARVRDLQLVIDPNGNITALWGDRNIPDQTSAIKACYKAVGENWESPETIIQQELSPSVDNPNIAVNVLGNAVVVWESRNIDGDSSIVQSSSIVRQPQPPPPPLPPSHFRGCLKWKKHAHKRHYRLKAKWTPSTSPNIKKYRIYKRKKVVEIVKPNEKLKFKTHLFWRSSARKFKIAAVDTNNAESKRTKLQVKPKRK